MRRTEAVGHAERWIDAWNAHDLDRIMSCYAEDVSFELRRSGSGGRKATARFMEPRN